MVISIKHRWIIISLFLFWVIPSTLSAQSATNDQEQQKSPEDLFTETFAARDYEACEAIIGMFSSVDTLSIQTILNASDCLSFLKKYDEEIAFCKKWGALYPEAFNDGVFDDKIGEAYYFLNDNKNAYKYLSRFFQWVDSVSHSPGSYITGVYAQVLSDEHKYQDADKMYKRYFDLSFQEEDVNWENLQYSKWKESYGYKLYSYAYNSIYLGNEKQGKYLLELSRKCGNERATEDYLRLNGFFVKFRAK